MELLLVRLSPELRAFALRKARLLCNTCKGRSAACCSSCCMLILHARVHVFV